MYPLFYFILTAAHQSRAWSKRLRSSHVTRTSCVQFGFRTHRLGEDNHPKVAGPCCKHSSLFTPDFTTGWPLRINCGLDSGVYDLHTPYGCYVCNLDQRINQLNPLLLPLLQKCCLVSLSVTVTPDELPKVNLGGVVGAV